MQIISSLGSVVSKRAISYLLSDSVKLSVYAPKSSIASLFSKAVEFENKSLFLSSIDSFNESVLMRDFKGNFFQEMKDSASSILIVDFYDEIFDLFALKQESTCITISNYLKLSNFSNLIDDQWVKVPLGSAEYWKRWELGCEKFSKDLPKDAMVILLEIYLPEHYENSNGHISKFSDKKLTVINKYNSILRKNYLSFKKMVECEVISKFSNKMVCQTPESEGTNFANINDSFCQELGMKISKKLGLDAQIKDTVEVKIETSLGNYSQLLNLDSIPTINELHSFGKKLIQRGDLEKAYKCEKLIRILHNSSVPLSVTIGKGSNFGYGGIGIVVHKDCELGKNVTIGSNVTLGGGKKIMNKDGQERTVPRIQDAVYIATGAKLLGGITIGHHSIIGANSVITKDVPPHSVVAGIPGKIINTINKQNFSTYSSYFYKKLPLKDSEKMIFENSYD
jgi:serine O-acetyltransferase